MKLSKQCQRVLSLLLAILFLATSMPSSVYASDLQSDLVTEYTEDAGDTVDNAEASVSNEQEQEAVSDAQIEDQSSQSDEGTEVNQLITSDDTTEEDSDTSDKGAVLNDTPEDSNGNEADQTTEDGKIWLADARFEVATSGKKEYIPAIDFNPEVTEYTADIAGTATLRKFLLTPTQEAVDAGVYYQFFLDGEPCRSVRDDTVIAPTQFSAAEEVNASKKTLSLTKVPMGTTHILQLCVGTLAEGEDTLEKENCNVYTITINRTMGLFDIVVQDEDRSTVTLTPAFHAQKDSFAAEVTGNIIHIKTQFYADTKTYIGDSTEPGSGATTYAWHDVQLADYTEAGSDTAVIPIRAIYDSGDEHLERTYTLSVKWPGEKKIWLADARFEVATSGKKEYIPAIDFNPEVTEYTADIAGTATLRKFLLTPTQEAVDAGVYYQFFLDGEPCRSVRDDTVIAPTQFSAAEEVNASAKTLSLTKVPMGTTHILQLCVGTLAEGEDTLEKENCNVYTITINRTMGLFDIVVQDEDRSTVTLTPAFHAQKDSFAAEVTGNIIHIKTQFYADTKTYIGDSTEPGSGATTYAWHDVQLADYTEAGSDTAVIPIRAIYDSGDEHLERTYTLSVKWPGEKKTWLTDGSFEVHKYTSSSYLNYWKNLFEFSPETTEYTTEIKDSIGYRRIRITPTEEAIENNVYYQFLWDDKPITNDDGEILPKKFEKAEKTDISEDAFALEQLPVGTTHVLKLLVGPKSDDATDLKEEDCNVYTFNLTRTFTIDDIWLTETATDSTKIVGAEEKQYDVEVLGDAVNIQLFSRTVAKGYLGNDENAVEGKPFSNSAKKYVWNNIKLSQYTPEGSNIATIPVKLVYEQGEIHLENAVTFSVKWSDPQNPKTPKITKKSEDVVCEKGDKVSLSVEVEPVEEGTISYQWYSWNYASGSHSYDKGRAIPNATEAIYTPATDTHVDKRYGCKVTNTTSDGETYNSICEIRFTVNLSYVNKPTGSQRTGNIYCKKTSRNF